MTGKLKILGITVMAAFAASALMASAAQAASVFHSEKENTTLTVTSNEPMVMVYEGKFKVECKKVTIFNTINLVGTTTTTAITVNPTFDECQDEAGLVAHVNMNGCDVLYTLTGNNEKDGPVEIKCPTGQSITMNITAGGKVLCTYHLAPQKPGGVAEYENEGAGTTRSLHIKHNLTGITATRTGSELCGKAESKVATLSGNVKVKGENPGGTEHVGIWVS